MDPADLYPYKPPQMRRVFEAFEAMLRRRACAFTGQAREPSPARHTEQP